jgi:hypothetical protein
VTAGRVADDGYAQAVAVDVEAMAGADRA